jgi:putative DNA primase/helicase
MATNGITAALGRWSDLLTALGGLEPAQLNGRHQPCPLCGGRDRYRFDDRQGSGSWFCNQCGGKDQLGGGGTGIDLLMRLRHWSYRQACEAVERYLELAPSPDEQQRHRPQPLSHPLPAALPAAGPGPVSGLPGGLPGHGSRPARQPETPPVDAPAPALGQGAIAQWCYRDPAGAQLFWVQRLCLGQGGRKAFLQRVWLDGGWHRPSRRDPFSCEWPTPRPLYGLPALGQRPEAAVLVVEGEATAEAAALLFLELVVISWANGTNAIAKTDWRPLAERSVTLWPDADAPGRKAMARLAALLAEQGCELQLVEPAAELPQGWDLADADWSPAEAAEHLRQWARPLPAAEDGTSAVAANSAGAANSGVDTHTEVAALAGGPKEKTSVRQTTANSTATTPANSSAAAPFQCLGYDGEGSFYRSYRTGQVLRLARSAHTAAHLVALAPLAHWETLYPSRSGVNWPAVASDLYECSIAAGLFSPERIRGRGAWWDENRPLLHLGDRLVTPDGEQPITAPFRSRFVYQHMPRLDGPGDVAPLTTVEAAPIVAIANRFRWEVPASGTLLLGWVVLAPICGALGWRPHLWLTGGAGSGKSAILDRYVTPLLGDFALHVSGSTTEAGLRQSIGSDAMPVVFDEAESNEKGDQQRMQGILALARVASSESGAAMLKGSPSGEVSRYRVRSMFLLSSIATALKQGADQGRFAQLSLGNPADLAKAERESHWAGLDRDLERQITPELGRRLIARSTGLIPVIRQAAAVFSRAAARHFDSQRLGDQYGTLLAGAWSLLSDVAPTEAEAELCIASHDWESYGQSSEQSDERRCLQVILQHSLRVECADRSVTRTIGELVELAAHQAHDLEIGADLASQTLGRQGLRLEPGQLLVSNTAQPIGTILRETAWSHGWSVLLLRLHGAQRRGPVRFCGAGMITRAVAIPLAVL